MRKLKIAHIGPPSLIPPRKYGGTQRLIYALAKKQAESGHDVTVFAGEESTIPGCKTKSFVNEDWIEKNWFGKKVLGFKHVLKCYSNIGKDFDIIHNHMWEEGIALSFLSKIPVLTTIHGQAPQKYYQKMITRICSMTKKTKLVTISNNAYNQNKKIYGKDLLGFIHNCIEPSHLKFYKNPIKKHQIELCFLGLLSPHKGPHIAIKLVERLHKEGKDVKLKIGGKIDKNYKDYTKKIFAIIENKSYIQLMQNISSEEIASFFGNSDALLFPIQWDEPFGLVMIESLFCGTPVIGFSRGSVPEIIEDKVNGFVCENENEMYDAILSIEMIERRKCHNSVLAKFTEDIVYKNYMQYYEQVIKDSNY